MNGSRICKDRLASDDSVWFEKYSAGNLVNSNIINPLFSLQTKKLR